MRLDSARFPLIYLITDGTLTADNFSKKSGNTLAVIRAAVSNRIPLVQIREKQLPACLLFEFVVNAVSHTSGSDTRLMVNDRADISLGAGADGVHLTGSSIMPTAIRSSFPKGFLIGISTHSLEAAKAARNVADFAVFGPVFNSPGKGEPAGLHALTEVCKQLDPFPVLALGGIDETNYRNVLECGASGFAAIRFLNDPENLSKLRS
ncbi:MAG: thiamine phosphate synthase [Pyrinomonadaceae bacterium]